jgi:excisionase family DNA binding protein
MDIHEVCELTTVSPSTIRRTVKKGALKCSNATGKLLFKVSDVESWLNNKQGV